MTRPRVILTAYGKKITLESLAAQLTKTFSDIETKIEKGLGSTDLKFTALAADIADIRNDMATKDQVAALHTQVNSIETEIRGMKHVKLHGRVADEEEVFGEAQA